MKMGTKSLLFGAHQVFIHPWFVAWAWWRLYGFPRDWRLWLCFLVHDWGYWGKAEMDNPEGEEHPKLGARIVHRLADRVDNQKHFVPRKSWDSVVHGRFMVTGWKVIEASADGVQYARRYRSTKWHDFCITHSRYYARKLGMYYSQLCVADKLAMALTPGWLYVPMAMATGEIWEYMTTCESRTYNPWKWHRDLRTYMLDWVDRHKNCETPDNESRHFYEEVNQ